MVAQHIERLSPARKRTIYRGTVLAFIAGAAWFGFNAYQIASKEPVSTHCDPNDDNSTYEEIDLTSSAVGSSWMVQYIDRCGDGTVAQYVARGAGEGRIISVLRNGSAEVIYTPSTRMTADDEISIDEEYRRLRSIYFKSMVGHDAR